MAAMFRNAGISVLLFCTIELSACFDLCRYHLTDLQFS
jgi:hypothetical protein